MIQVFGDHLHLLIGLMQHNKYKQHIINDKIPDGTSTTVYRCGPLIDLCYGPHIPHTGKIKAFMVTKVWSVQLLNFGTIFFDWLSPSLEFGIIFPW